MFISQEAYLENGSWGILTSVDLHNCNPETIRDADAIRKFVVALCEKIDVTRFGECQVVHFGEDEEVAGYSMVQLIETSLLSGHFANKTNHTYLDIFSCKWYDQETVVAYAQDYFGATDHTVNVVLRK